MNVSSISLYEYCPNLVILSDIEKPENIYMKMGREIHEKFGFNNRRKYIAIIPHLNLEIVGIPDLVTDKYVYELKTVSSPYRAKIYHKAHIFQLKIYMYLTGKKGVLLIYNTKENKFINTYIINEINKKQLLRNIYYAAKYYRQGKIDRRLKSRKCRHCIMKTYCIATEYESITKFI